MAPCADACSVPDGGSHMVLDAGACGSLGDLDCQDNLYLTDQQRADRMLQNLTACCGGWGENQLIVTLSGGCATEITMAQSPPGTDAFLQCVSAQLDGRRILCGTALSCMTQTWSTLP